MRLRSLWVLPSHAATLVFAAVFLSYLDLYLEIRGRLPIPILAVNLCLIALVVLAAGTLGRAAARAGARARLIGMYRSHVAVLLALAAIVSASFVSAFSSRAYLDEGPRWVLYPAYSAALVVLSMLVPFPVHRRRHLRLFLFVAFVVTVASVLTDVVHPGTFSMLPDRAAGFAQNPNSGGFLVIALCCAVLSFERVGALDLLVLAATAGAVVATLSRAAIIMFVFVAGCYAVCVVRNARRRGIGTILGGIAGLAILITVAATSVSYLIEQPMFATPGSRLGMLLGREEVVGPRESRVQLLHSSWQLVLDSPLLGYGSGFTSTMRPGPHNIYISRWLDNGLPGVVSFVWLLGAVGMTFWKRRYAPGLVFAGVLVMEGFFSHNLLEERAFLILVGIHLGWSFFLAMEPIAASARRESRAMAHRAHPARPAAASTVSA